MTLPEFVESLARFGERTAVIGYSSAGKEVLDYAALGARIQNAASHLANAGIGSGSTVALWGPNGAANRHDGRASRRARGRVPGDAYVVNGVSRLYSVDSLANTRMRKLARGEA